MLQTFQDGVKTNVLSIIKKDALMASIDLKDALYSVPVAAHH